MRKHLLSLLMLCIIGINMARAAETEPNNTWNTANVLTSAVTATGTISTPADEDWFRLRINTNGSINFSGSVSSGGCATFQLFDTLGLIAINGIIFNCGGTSNQLTDGLAAGTYFLKVISSNSNVSYSLSLTFIAPLLANDPEPNNTRPTATNFGLNSTRAGHFGYYFNALRDTFDWYRIVLPDNGAIQLSYTQNTGNNCSYFQIFDNNGTTALNSEVFNCGGTSTQTTDGLQAGVYFVRIRPANNTTIYGTYTLQNIFIPPAIPADPEPNNTKNTATTLAVNATETGHIGYRASGNIRDTFDWYKINTTLAGAIRLEYTQNTGNNCSYAQLFDNNGTSVLNAEIFNCGGTSVQLTDGLNPGTYFVRIRPANTTSFFGTYTLKGSLELPLVPTDPEPNNTPSVASILGVNESANGQTGYYYNNFRDSADWYKITIPSGGGLQLQFTQLSGNNCHYFQLFDTVVNNVLVPRNTEVLNCGGTSAQNTDGLGAGTYYVRIRPGNTANVFGTYTLKDTLIALPPDNDNRPNERAFQAGTIPANSTVTGNVGYTFNALRDSVDWAKINYTGTGNMTLQFTSQNRAFSGATCLVIRVYSDTNAAPINTTLNCGGTSVINLTGLTQRYYYLQVETNNPAVDFGQYSVANFFAEVNKASVSLIGSTQPTDCNPTGVLRVQCSGSRPPYTLRLFRFGVFDRSVRINNTSPTNITGLPNGIWTGRVFGDGASDTAFGTLIAATLMPVPTGLNTTNITTTQARLNFSNYNPCIDGYGIQYRKLGDIPWILDTARQSPFTLRGLSPATAYQWRVASGDTANGFTAVSSFSALSQFTTASSLIIASYTPQSEDAQSVSGTFKIHPNPATHFFTIKYNGAISGKINFVLSDMNGRVVQTNQVDAKQLNSTRIYTNALATGIYQIQLRATDGMIIATEKVIVQR